MTIFLLLVFILQLIMSHSATMVIVVSNMERHLPSQFHPSSHNERAKIIIFFRLRNEITFFMISRFYDFPQQRFYLWTECSQKFL